jgi:hypothetical protein
MRKRQGGGGWWRWLVAYAILGLAVWFSCNNLYDFLTDNFKQMLVDSRRLRVSFFACAILCTGVTVGLIIAQFSKNRVKRDELSY